MALQNLRERHDGVGPHAPHCQTGLVGNKKSGGAVDLAMVGNRSLSPRSTHAIILVASVLLAIGGLRAWFMGAWPIAVFMLADAALFAAFMLAFARRDPPRERLRIRDGQIMLEQHWPGGVSARFPLWQARLEENEGHDGDYHLRLQVPGRTIQLASMLSAPERREIAAVVRKGLGRLA